MNSDDPRIAQFTAIKGRNIPSEPYKAGDAFSMIISTNCTIAAITAMKTMNCMKVRSTDSYAPPIQAIAPSLNIFS